MISENALAGLQHIFRRAVSASLALNPGDTISIEPLAAQAIVATPQQQVVVLTVVSYRFRLLTFFHLGSDPACVDYFTRGDAGRVLGDVFGELGNLCCGAMNRDLGQHFAHTGMSTPYLLEGGCLPFINTLDPAHLAHYRIVVNGALQINASLCLCAYAPIDFSVDTQSAAEACGELELF